MGATATEPSEGLLSAARAGELEALRALADFYRERGLPADENGWVDSDETIALQLEAWAFETEERHVQARKLRRLLAMLAPKGAFGPTRRATLDDLRRHVSRFGLPVEVFPMRRTRLHGDPPDSPLRPMWGGNTDTDAGGYALILPTDGQHEDETIAVLLAHLREHFTSATDFEVMTHNSELSEAGEGALFVLSMRA